MLFDESGSALLDEDGDVLLDEAFTTPETRVDTITAEDRMVYV